MPPADEAQETFAAWRIWIIKTLDKLSQDVEALKTLTNDRGEYLRRFEIVEREVKEAKEHILSLNVSAAVSRRTLAMWGSIAAFIGAGVTAVLSKVL
jgi:hypothetical protein